MFSLTNGLFSLGSGFKYLTEMEQIISRLEQGTIVTKFSWRKGAEKKRLLIRRETGQLLCSTITCSTKLTNGALNLREVKEIRLGKCSKDFDKWSDEVKEIENLKCFVIFYGSEFKLRILSIVAQNEEECKLWIKGLRYFVKDTLSAPYSTKVQEWLQREFLP
ncbi:hypothetical protein HHI36_020753 [Cryptolaemus montrouzieri]|uniref:PH domain-containing protein n=1 Tax=Cryptolaemus montrouzieri TaxID=559131 RepID=A0ABD2NBN1_9CUCU